MLCPIMISGINPNYKSDSDDGSPDAEEAQIYSQGE